MLENSMELSCTGTVRHTRITWKSGRMGDFYVTSEARAGCEQALVGASMDPSSSEVQRTLMGPPWGGSSSAAFTYGLKN